MGNTRSQHDDINRARGQLLDIIKTYKIETVEDTVDDIRKDVTELFQDVFDDEEEALKDKIDEIQDKTDDEIKEEIKEQSDKYKDKKRELESFTANIPAELEKQKKEIENVNKADKEKAVEQDKLLNKMYQENLHRQEINRELAKMTPGSNGCSSNVADELELEDKKNIEDIVQEEFDENEDEQIGGYIANKMYELNRKYIENTPEDNHKLIIKSSASKK